MSAGIEESFNTIVSISQYQDILGTDLDRQVIPGILDLIGSTGIDPVPIADVITTLGNG